MAGKTTTVSAFKEYSTGVKIIKVSFLADAADATIVTGTVKDVDGKRLIGIWMVNGTTGMTSTADLDVTDSISGVNLTATNGDNHGGNSVSAYFAPDTANVIVLGSLAVTISSNAVNSATCDVYLAFDSKWS